MPDEKRRGSLVRRLREKYEDDSLYNRLSRTMLLCLIFIFLRDSRLQKAQICERILGAAYETEMIKILSPILSLEKLEQQNTASTH